MKARLQSVSVAQARWAAKLGVLDGVFDAGHTECDVIVVGPSSESRHDQLLNDSSKSRSSWVNV